jgi:hypothetical protein
LVRESNIFHLKIDVASQIFTVLTVLLLLGLLATLLYLLITKHKELIALIYFPQSGATDWVIIIFLA